MLGRFLTTARHSTMVVIFYAVVTRFTRMLAFMLPLKVVLLAGSEGVPRYFQLFLSPEQRDEGIIALSVAAIASYIVTLMLDARIKTLSERGSMGVLASATQMHLVANQGQEAQGYYETFTGLIAGIAFSALGFSVLGVLNPVLLAYLFGFTLLCFGLAALGVQKSDPRRPNSLSNLVVKRTNKFLSLCSAIAFLSSFLVILYPFLAGSNGNILVAIIAIILLRRILAAITDGIKDAKSLTADRKIIDALFFPDQQLTRTITKGRQTLFDLFAAHNRTDAIAQPLSHLLEAGEHLEIDWLDPALRGTAEFVLSAKSDSGSCRRFRLRAFPPRLHYLVENEELLFKHMDRETLQSPTIAAHYEYAGFKCRVWAVDARNQLAPAAWRKLEISLFSSLWAIELPSSLIKTYTRSHRLLHDRLNEEFIHRLDIAVNTERQAALLAELHTHLPEIRTLLSTYPLSISRKRASSGDIVEGAAGHPKVVNWGQWALEPLGAETHKFSLSSAQVATMLEGARAQRKSIPDSFGPEDLLLTSNLAGLESAILQDQLQKGLNMASRAVSQFAKIRSVANLQGEAVSES